MEEDFMFNIDDIDISEDSINIISDEPVKKQDSIEQEEEQEEITSEDIQEKQEEIIKEDPPSSEANSSQSTLYALAKYLKDEGVLFIEEELKDIENLDDLKALIQKSNDQAKYANLTESQKRYQDALVNGVPTKEYETIEKEISTFQKIDKDSIDTDVQLKYEILAIDFMNQGIEQSKAMKLAEIAVKDESSTQDAKEALDNIITFKTNKYKELLSTKKEQTDLDLTNIKKSIDGKQKILEMPVNDITKNKLFDLMTTKVATDDNGLPLNKLQKFQKENPIESNILMNYLFMMTNEGKDLGLIKTNTTSLAAKELEKKLKSLNFDSSGSLIIPDEMISRNNKNSNEDTLTINIK